MSVSVLGFLGGLDSKEATCNGGYPGLIPGEGKGNLQHSCLENSMDRGARRATVHEAAKSWTRLSG